MLFRSNNGSLRALQAGSEWPHGDGGPVCGLLGPPEMVSAASIPNHGDIVRNSSRRAMLEPGWGLWECVFLPL